MTTDTEIAIKPIPLDAPDLTGNERRYLNECIDTNWISWQGEFVGRTEQKLAHYCGTEFGLTLANGTYALVLALQALEVGPGDEVIVPTFTMSATAFAVTTVGATVVWADVDPHSLTLSATDVARKITPKTKAVMAVHLYGRAVDMAALLAVTSAKGIPVVEDVAEGLGARTDDKPVGGWGTIACHSFHNKIVASGEGGAITLNDPQLYETLNMLRTPPPDNAGSAVIALNHRMSNITAAVALAQLERIDSLVAKRRQVAQWYTDRLQKQSNLSLFPERDNEHCVFWRYQVSLASDYPLSNKSLVQKLKAHGVEARPVFTLMSDHPYYKPLSEGSYPNAEAVSVQSLDLPSSPHLSEAQVDYICQLILNPNNL